MMYTIQELVTKYKGVSVDFDNQFGAQCVDFIRFKWHMVDGIPRQRQPNTTPSAGAKDLINNLNGTAFRARAAGEDPQVGDAVIWGANRNNPWGHVAVLVAINGTPDCRNYEVMEQDGLNQGRGAQLRVVSPVGITGFICLKD